ncbi:MAG TPA: helix-turn-helix domain-containing protein [Gemmataceae bacterium]|nr:helix-turn-helix domain-containing protein [Gemmataceae bacterium]
MPRIKFRQDQIAALRAVARHAPTARHARRAQTLLELADGDTVTAVAARHRVSRMAVYDWLARFREGGASAWDRLKDRPRSGRPAVQRAAATEAIRAALATRPTDHGYRHPGWTAGLLRRHLEHNGVVASRTTVRRALHGLGYRWKRPRHSLARRKPTWRQAKGG